MKKTVVTSAALAAFTSLALATPAMANENSPYTPAAGGVEAEISYTRQAADSFNAGEATVVLPVELKQSTVALDASYGITDRLALDFRVGYAKSDFAVDPTLSPQGGLEDVNDIMVGARFKVLDEVNGGPFTATISAAAIIETGYTTGAITAVGDGGSGGQVALNFGKQFGPLSYSSSIGYRTRSNDIPDEVFGSSTLAVSFADRFSVYGGVSFVDSSEGLDVGGPGFTPARFPELEEDYKLWNVGAAVSFTENLSINAGYGKKFDGKNTAKSDFFRVGLGFSF
jgi:hypothetical protein